MKTQSHVLCVYYFVCASWNYSVLHCEFTFLCKFGSYIEYHGHSNRSGHISQKQCKVIFCVLFVQSEWGCVCHWCCLHRAEHEHQCLRGNRLLNEEHQGQRSSKHVSSGVPGAQQTQHTGICVTQRPAAEHGRYLTGKQINTPPFFRSLCTGMKNVSNHIYREEGGATHTNPVDWDHEHWFIWEATCCTWLRVISNLP